MIKSILRFFILIVPTFYYCLRSGIPYDSTYRLAGNIRIIRRPFYLPGNGGEIVIGKSFISNNRLTSNSIGLIQPCVFNISTPNSFIIIGKNVGISGSTINATTSITIGDNVLIGSGCIISDTDSHPLGIVDRNNGLSDSIKSSPIKICNNVFIGARCLILKGVTIGEWSVIGAGSVVTKNIPPNSIYAGNPAQFIKKIV